MCKSNHLALSYILLVAVFMVLVTSSNSGNIRAHTMHNITSSEGHWLVRLSVATAHQSAYFSDCDGKSLGQIADFDVTKEKPACFGLGFTPDHITFDVAYTLAAYSPNENLQMVSRSCFFIVSAEGPMQPTVWTHAAKGAKCDWKVVKYVGLDFFLG